MKNRTAYYRTPRRELPVVVRELVDRLLADDWTRYSSTDNKHFYYVVGHEAHYKEVHQEISCSNMEFSSESNVQANPLLQKYLRAQLARKQPSYFQQVTRLLKQKGIPPVSLEKIASGEIKQFPRSLFKTENLKLLTILIEAYLAETSNDPEQHLDEDLRTQLTVALQKVALLEISRKYEKLVGRWKKLKALTYEDAQLEEATRCFLYGFYRASVVLSASALEKYLKRAANIECFQTYADLVEKTQKAGKLNDDFTGMAKGVFQQRNKIVHDNKEPDIDLARQMLEWARLLIEHLVPVQNDG